MPCPVCKGVCRCGASNTGAFAAAGEPATVLVHPEAFDSSEERFAINIHTPPRRSDGVASAEEVELALEIAARESTKSKSRRRTTPAEAAAPETDALQSEMPAEAWRMEVLQRVSRYRARRKPRTNRSSTLPLNFEGAAAARKSPLRPRLLPQPRRFTLPKFEPTLEEVLEIHTDVYGLLRCYPVLLPPTENPFWKKARNLLEQSEQAANGLTSRGPQTHNHSLFELLDSIRNAEQRSESRNVIEFPRTTAPLIAEEGALAEPVAAAPRIFEAEDVAQVELEEKAAATAVASPPVASLTLEYIPVAEMEPPLAESQLLGAPMRARLNAALIDTAGVVAATLLFILVLNQMDALPQGRMAWAIMSTVSSALWALYNYIFLVYAGCTPGMRFYGLRLADFKGAGLSRARRRARAASMALSCFSFGLGYVWALLDADRLCWHDRITHTLVVAENR